MGEFLALLKIITIKMQQTIMLLLLQEIKIMGGHPQMTRN